MFRNRKRARVNSTRPNRRAPSKRRIRSPDLGNQEAKKIPQNSSSSFAKIFSAWKISEVSKSDYIRSLVAISYYFQTLETKRKNINRKMKEEHKKINE